MKSYSSNHNVQQQQKQQKEGHRHNGETGQQEYEKRDVDIADFKYGYSENR